MNGSTTLQALILMAQMAGVKTGPEIPQEPAPWLTVSLAEIAQHQEAAYSSYPIGQGEIDFAMGFDHEAGTWIKLRQQGKIEARSLEQIREGSEVKMPLGTYRLIQEKDLIVAVPLLPPQEPQAHVSLPALIRNIYQAALHVKCSMVEYAISLEDNGDFLSSLSLIRKDHQGRYWLSYGSLEALKRMRWIVAVNGMMYGMKLEGNNLVFYSQPAPPAPSVIPEIPIF